MYCMVTSPYNASCHMLTFYLAIYVPPESWAWLPRETRFPKKAGDVEYINYNTTCMNNKDGLNFCIHGTWNSGNVIYDNSHRSVSVVLARLPGCFFLLIACLATWPDAGDQLIPREASIIPQPMARSIFFFPCGGAVGCGHEIVGADLSCYTYIDVHTCTYIS